MLQVELTIIDQALKGAHLCFIAASRGYLPVAHFGPQLMEGGGPLASDMVGASVVEGHVAGKGSSVQPVESGKI